MRGIQQSLLPPSRPPVSAMPVEPKELVYTKRWVVELLLDLAGYRSEINLVDVFAAEPAAGDGAFLGPMVARLIDSCENQGRPPLVVGLLSDHGVKRPLAERLTAGWVRTGDYLFEAAMAQADFVIGNPPYVRLEDIPEETASLYRDADRTMQ